MKNVARALVRPAAPFFVTAVRKSLVGPAKRVLAPICWSSLLSLTQPKAEGFDSRRIENAKMDPEILRHLQALLGEVKGADASYFESMPWVHDYFLNALPRMNATIGVARRWVGKQGVDAGVALGFMDIILRDRYGLKIVGLERQESIPLYCPWVISKGLEVRPWSLNANNLPCDQGSQDFVIFAEVLEHLKLPPGKVLRVLADMLKRRGQLLLTTPNVASFENIRKLASGQNVAEPFPNHLTMDEDPTDHIKHVREYTIAEVVALIQGAGLLVEQILMCNWGRPHAVPKPYLNEVMCLLATKPEVSELDA